MESFKEVQHYGLPQPLTRLCNDKSKPPRHCEGAKRTKQSIILHTENFTIESLEYKGVHYYRLPRMLRILARTQW